MIKKFLQISGLIVLQVLRNTNEEAGNFPFFGTMCDNDFISWYALHLSSFSTKVLTVNFS